MIEQNAPKSASLARKLAIWIGGFFFLAALLLLAWTTSLQRKESLAELKNLARTNAAFVGDLGFPLSRQLASQLSNILDLGVGFYSEKSINGTLPEEFVPQIREMAELNEPTSRRVSDSELAIAPLAKGGGYLILIRTNSPTTSIFGPSFYLPAIVLAIGCAALAFGLGRSIVRPLQTLTRWLPNLNTTTSVSEADSIPTAISGRADEVGILSRALLETRDQLAEEKEKRALSERLAALGRVATSLAHEVKNPAAAIQMHADLLLENARSEDAESLQMIRDEVEQITGLVNQWLFVAKSQPPKTRVQDLREILSKVARRMQPAIDHADVRLKIDTTNNEPVPVDVDSVRIEQVLRNLIQNAAQAMPKGGEISVKLERTDQTDSVKLVVRDQGEGFSEEALARFGEPFFSEREGGMGIGLTVSTEVINSHGGTISPSNHETGGASVIINLPTATGKT